MADEKWAEFDFLLCRLVLFIKCMECETQRNLTTRLSCLQNIVCKTIRDRTNRAFDQCANLPSTFFQNNFFTQQLSCFLTQDLRCFQGAASTSTRTRLRFNTAIYKKPLNFARLVEIADKLVKLQFATLNRIFFSLSPPLKHK